MQDSCFYLVWGPANQDLAAQFAEQLPGTSSLYWFWDSVPGDFLSGIPNTRLLPISEPFHPRRFRLRGFRRYQILRSGPLGPHRAASSKFIKDFEEYFASYWRNNATLMVLGDRMISNLARNLLYFNQLDQAPPPLPNLDGRKLQLLGAGPSLLEAMTELRLRRKEYFLLAVDSAYPILVDHGIEPDGLVILESQYWNSHDFLPLPKKDLREFQGWVFADLTSNPMILRLFSPERILPFLSRFSDEEFFEHLAGLGIHSIPPLGNVGNCALYLAKSLGQSEILASGFDFATRVLGQPTQEGHHHRLLLETYTRLGPAKFSPGKRDVRAYYVPPGAEEAWQGFRELGLSLAGDLKIVHSLRGQETLSGQPGAWLSPARIFLQDCSWSGAGAFLSGLAETCQDLMGEDLELASFLQAEGSIFLIGAPAAIGLDQLSRLKPYLRKTLYQLGTAMGK